MVNDTTHQALVADQAAVAAELAAFRAEYVEGRRASMANARGAAEFQSAAKELLVVLDHRTQTLARTQDASLEQQRITTGRVTELEKKAIAAEALAAARSWRFPALIAFVASVASGSMVALVAVLLR